MQNFIKALKLFLWLSLLTGFLYPMLITGIAQLMPHRAGGSMMISKGKSVGSLLIAQNFESNDYFWSRPSAGQYNPLTSGGSNLGPTSLVLKDLVKKREELIIKAHGEMTTKLIPSELLYASGSGLDPHISLNTAYFQLERVAKARHLNDSDKQSLHKVIKDLNTVNDFSELGGHYVNVLELNLSVDRLYPRSSDL